MKSPTQIALRHLLLALTVLCCLFGGYAWFGRFQGAAQREAIRQAIREGRLEPEEGRWALGDDVDRLQPRQSTGTESNVNAR